MAELSQIENESKKQDGGSLQNIKREPKARWRKSSKYKKRAKSKMAGSPKFKKRAYCDHFKVILTISRKNGY